MNAEKLDRAKAAQDKLRAVSTPTQPNAEPVPQPDP